MKNNGLAIVLLGNKIKYDVGFCKQALKSNIESINYIDDDIVNKIGLKSVFK